jgi:AraC-type DNA-binding domain-containing proteins
MLIFSWQQNKVNEKEKLTSDLNSFSNFNQIIEKKVLSDVDNVMSTCIQDILAYNVFSGNDPKNPFVYSDNPFDTTLSYLKRLEQLRDSYPYITSIDLYSYKFDTYISSSTSANSGGVFFNAFAHKNDLQNSIPYNILDAIKSSDSGRIWISPKQNNLVERYKGKASLVQRLPLFSAPSGNDAIIIINIDPEIVYNTFLKNQVLFNSHFYIVDQKSNVILKTSSEQYLSEVLNKSSQANNIKNNPNGTGNFVYDKAEYNIIWQTSSVSDWKYIYLSQSPSAFAQLILSLRFVLSWFIVVFIVCLIITMLVSKEIYKPIGALLKYTSSILKSSDNDKKDDIGEITNAFTSINNQLTHYKETIGKNSSLLLNNIAISLLEGNVHDLEELNSWLSVLNMKFDNDSFFIFIIKVDMEVYESLNNQNRDIFLLCIREYVENYYASKNITSLKLISCYHHDGVMPFIINIDKEQYFEEKEAASIILSNMNEEISSHISIAVSDVISDLLEFNNEYERVINYFKYVFICGNKTIFDREKVESFENNIGIYDIAIKKHLKSLLKLCKFEDFKLEIGEFYYQAKQRNYSLLYLHTLSAEIISMIINEFQYHDIDLPKLQEGNLMSSFSKLKSIDLCAEWFNNIIDILSEGIQNKSITIDSKYMKSILEYIDNDLSNVTLNSVADKFKISTAHLSRVFKKQTGRNFSDYVSEKRLEQACRLILTTDMKISDIVSKMGYQNINYFNKIFKLQYNLTPTQYRKQYQV